MSDPIVERLSVAFAYASTSELADRFRSDGSDPIPMMPSELGMLLADDVTEMVAMTKNINGKGNGFCSMIAVLCHMNACDMEISV